ncbi:MAG: GH116 family glycosyl-hydrolase [Armatimonadota bacterium]
MRRLLPIVVTCALAGDMAASVAQEGAQQYLAVVSAEPDLAAYWRFEGDCQDTRDAAHGQPRGGEPQFAPGPAGGQALALAEGRYLTMGDAPDLDLPETTVELWFRATFRAPAPYNPCLIAKRNGHRETRFSIHLDSTYAALHVWNGRQVITFAPAGGELRPGRWYYLAVTCAQRELRAYLDGVPCPLKSPTGTFSFHRVGLPLQIGSSTPEGREHLEADIDEVAIYGRVLSPEDIARHADAMGWKARREQAAALERDRLQAERALAAEREAQRAERMEELMAEQRLFAQGETRVYRGENLTAISFGVGGIGTGSVQVNGQARPAIWQIFGNFEHASVPNSFFAIQARAPGSEPVLRALQTTAVGPFAAMGDVSFRGEYPFGWFDFEDPDLPVQVSMELFNPLVPLETRDSAIPCAIYNLSVRNPARKPVELSLLAAQQNAVGFTGKGEIEGRAFDGYGGNTNRVLREGGATILHMTSGGEADGGGSGDMALAALSADATAAAEWTSLETLAAELAGDGSLAGPAQAGPSPQGETIDGALAVALSLKPREQRTVAFVLTWHFPGAGHGARQWGGPGSMYENWWPDALAVAREVVARLDELTARTRLYHDTLYESNLPHWLLDRISSQVAVLRSQTCFWTKGGYFGGWEGCQPQGGCCHGNCNHVWHYAQAHARLFPEIARTMRQQEFRFQAPDGAIPHRQPQSHPAFDGQCGAVLGTWREHLNSPDRAWLDQHWPDMKLAMDYLIARWDQDEDGILAGAQWNTLDGEVGGSTSWLGSLYLAALAAAEKAAELEGDTEAARRYRRIRQTGSKKQDETLFNGQYYIQVPDDQARQDYLSGCHIDQVLGQWWAHQLNLGQLYPPEHLRSALQSLMKHNFRADFHGIRQAPRKFVDDDDAGMQMITWPRGGRPATHTRYADEVMTGFEYAAAAAMVQADMLREGFAVVRAISDRYDGRLRTGLTGAGTASWGYSGNPFGDDECGKFYARAMSVWSLLLACQGFIYDGPAGLIGFKPVWRPDDHASFFTGAQGWGLFTQRRSRGRQTELLEVRHGKLRLTQMVCELPPGKTARQVTARVGKRRLPAEFTCIGSELRVTLAEPLVLEADGELRVVASW